MSEASVDEPLAPVAARPKKRKNNSNWSTAAPDQKKAKTAARNVIAFSPIAGENIIANGGLHVTKMLTISKPGWSGIRQPPTSPEEFARMRADGTLAHVLSEFTKVPYDHER